jgi:drug/metabolite transporter (DMT)-like permease
MRQGNGRAWKLPLAVFFMAISFFSFTQLLRIAPLSFAVPASAASIAFDTVLARVVLKEKVEFRRWAGAILVAGGVILLAQ